MPLYTIPKLEKIIVGAEVLAKIKSAIEKASEIYFNETDRIYIQRGDQGLCGWGNIITYEINTEITQALIDLDFAYSFGKGYYHIRLLKGYPCQSMDVDESGKILAAEYLTKELGQSFSTTVTWD